MATIALAFLTGILSILAPCVLPLVPIVVAGAAARHPAGPVALAAGLALSFTLLGLFVATIGFSLGLDDQVLRPVGGALLLIAGLVLLTPRLQRAVAVAAGPVSAWAQRRTADDDSRLPGWGGPFALGLGLGLVWAPCVGPTLGAALGLAAAGESLGGVALTMLAFGLGAALPLALLGQLSQAALQRWRHRLAGTGKTGRLVLGVLLAVLGVLILTGVDKAIEAFLVEHSPDWLTDLTVRF